MVYTQPHILPNSILEFTDNDVVDQPRLAHPNSATQYHRFTTHSLPLRPTIQDLEAIRVVHLDIVQLHVYPPRRRLLDHARHEHLGRAYTRILGLPRQPPRLCRLQRSVERIRDRAFLNR